jgi:hypothetical protein
MGSRQRFNVNDGSKVTTGKAGYTLKVAAGPANNQFKAVYFELFKNGTSQGVIQTINFPVGTATTTGAGPQQTPSA